MITGNKGLNKFTQIGVIGVINILQDFFTGLPSVSLFLQHTYTPPLFFY